MAWQSLAFHKRASDEVGGSFIAYKRTFEIVISSDSRSIFHPIERPNRSKFKKL